MAILDILEFPDPRLRTVAQPVKEVDARVQKIVDDMFETMYDAPGRGLAAPQVGVMQRVFVMDAGWKEGDMTPLVCINPSILSASDEQAVATEGCLSVPGVTADVTRPAEITLAFTDLTGTARQLSLSGAEATIAQHEYDHLDGVLHFDRLDPAGRDALLAAYETGQGA